jgi:hypothetical protein
MDVSLEKAHIHMEIERKRMFVNRFNRRRSVDELQSLPANATFSNWDKFTSGSNSTDVSNCHLHKEHSQIILVREEL